MQYQIENKYKQSRHKTLDNNIRRKAQIQHQIVAIQITLDEVMKCLMNLCDENYLLKIDGQ